MENMVENHHKQQILNMPESTPSPHKEESSESFNNCLAFSFGKLT